MGRDRATTGAELSVGAKQWQGFRAHKGSTAMTYSKGMAGLGATHQGLDLPETNATAGI